MKWGNSKNRGRGRVWGAVVLALGAGLCTSAAQSPDAASHVSVSGHLARVPVRNGESVRFWITIENGSASPIARIRLDRIDPVDFDRVSGSMSVPSERVCQAPAVERPKGLAVTAPAPQNEICAYLGPHESFTVWGDLRASESVDRQNAFAILEWESAEGPSVIAAPLGEIESLSCPRWFWFSLLHNWELGVPTFTAFFAGLFALWKWRWDKREADLHEKRENESRIQRDLEEKREARLHEERDKRSNTWNLMLQDSHRVTLKYYMPICNDLIAATQEIRRFHDAHSPNVAIAQSAFYYLLKFEWNVRTTRRELGGYYFKNRTAEWLVYFLYQEHRALLRLKSPPIQQLLDRCLDLMSAKVTSSTVGGMIGYGDPDIVAFWKYARKWLSNRRCLQDLNILDGYFGILIYEANRPYEHWYDVKLEPLKLSALARTAVTDVAREHKLGPETDKYLEEAGCPKENPA
jgi:hypothetical protein